MMGLWWCANCKSLVSGQFPGTCLTCGGKTVVADIKMAQAHDEYAQKNAKFDKMMRRHRALSSVVHAVVRHRYELG